ncbi:hypothetical protein E5358_06915 [Palleniella muris]|uniref:Uncharacterized protein n=1 Tax=Palleniella muris TaxID=3038145 RepID=A0AC61QQJ4_9BACT|nr:hypothetical protein [Palleniella muris]TGX82493.1 hypothetical protein E5358_06915 [Palleniella muris]
MKKTLLSILALCGAMSANAENILTQVDGTRYVCLTDASEIAAAHAEWYGDWCGWSMDLLGIPAGEALWSSDDLVILGDFLCSGRSQRYQRC